MASLKDLVVAGNFEELDKIETASSGEGKQYQRTFAEDAGAAVLEEFETEIVVGKYLKRLNDFKDENITQAMMDEIHAANFTMLYEYVDSGQAPVEYGNIRIQLGNLQKKYREVRSAASLLNNTLPALKKQRVVDATFTQYPDQPPTRTKRIIDQFDFEVAADATEYLLKLINTL